MPVFNLTVPDTSPLIVYAGGQWGDSSHADPEINGYINATFHATQDNGATASLTFNGSAVYVFGAKRTNHGQYTATLDGASTVASGFSPSDVFNQLLYSQTDLQTKQHQLVLTNQWAGSTETFFDVDYMLVTSGDGNPNTPSVDVTMDDGDQNITYSAGWLNSPNNLIQDYFNKTMHRTQTLGASASVRFYGNAITVYGATSGNHGLFSISLDEVPIPSNLNGSSPAFRPQNMLYYSGGLSTSLHTLSISNVDSTGLFFDLDKVVVSTWPVELVTNSTSTRAVAPSTTRGTATSLSNGSVGGTATSSSDTATSSRVNTAAIAGGVVAAILVVVLSVGVFFLIRRRRRRRAYNYETNVDILGPEEARVQPFVSEPWVPPQNNAPDVRTISESQTLFSPPASTSYGYGKAKTTPSTTSMSTSVPEMENPHRDFPPPGYEEATASNQRG